MDDTAPILIIVGIVILAILAILYLLISEHSEYRDFMAECQVDHKHYECEVMYKTANPPGPVIITNTYGR